MANSKQSSPILTSGSTPDDLTLAQACSLAVLHHPSLATYPMDQRATDARILKATRLPNPVLSFDAEDFFGTGGTSGLSSSVLNAVLSQVVERGGKRKARTDAARADGALMNAEYDLMRLKLIQKTGELYIDAVAAHENVAFLQTSLDRSTKTLNLVKKLSDVGRITKSAVLQADLEVQKMEFLIASAKKERQMASLALTAQWGDQRGTLFSGSWLGAPPRALPSKSSIQSGLAKHPSIHLAQVKIAQAEANLQLAKSGSYSNIALGAGSRKDHSSNERSGLFQISIPLKIFDKKHDGINEMTALLEKAKAESEGKKRLLDTTFLLDWSELVSDYEAAQRVKNQLLPVASALFKSAEDSFRVGKITSLEYLAAQQQFHEIRSKWLSTRHNYQISAARLQALTNRSF